MSDKAAATFKYQLTADSGYSATGEFRISPNQYRQVVAALRGTLCEAHDGIPIGFSKESLVDVADALEAGYEKTVNVGNVTGEGDEHLESTTAYAARLIRALIAGDKVPEFQDVGSPT